MKKQILCFAFIATGLVVIFLLFSQNLTNINITIKWRLIFLLLIVSVLIRFIIYKKKPKLINLNKPLNIEGFKVFENKELGIKEEKTLIKELNQTDSPVFSLYRSVKQTDQDFIKGFDIKEEITQKNKKPLNSSFLNFLLNNTKKIPKKLKSGKIFFWGTIYIGPNNKLFVCYLEYNNKQNNWYLGCKKIKNNFCYNEPALVMRVS